GGERDRYREPDVALDEKLPDAAGDVDELAPVRLRRRVRKSESEHEADGRDRDDACERVRESHESEDDAAERQSREAAGVIPRGQAAELFAVMRAGELAHERLDRDPERAARAEGERLSGGDDEIAIGGEQRRSRKPHHEKAGAQRAALAEAVGERAAAEADDELDQNR